MKDGICPKCGASEVYHGPLGWADFTSGLDMSQLPLTASDNAALTNYVCASCGYLERYVVDPGDRLTITKRWEKVRAEGGAEPGAAPDRPRD
jgi:hypothetical protein